MWLAGGQGWGYQTDIGDGGLERDIFFFYWMNYRALTSEADSAGIESLE